MAHAPIPLVPLPVAGDIAIAVVALGITLYEGWLCLQHPTRRAHLWAMVVAASSGVFAAVQGLQYMAEDFEPIGRLLRIQFVALIAMVGGLLGFASAVSRPLPFPRPARQALVALALLAVVGVVFTNAVITTAPLPIEVGLVPHVVFQCQPGPAMAPLLVLLLTGAAVSTGWVTLRATTRAERLIHGVTLAVWVAASGWDALLALGLVNSTPLFLMEYGFGLVSAGVMAVDVGRYSALLRQSEVSRVRADESFRNFIARTPMPALVHQDGRVVCVNDALTTALGQDTSAPLLGSAALDLVHPLDRPHATAAASAARDAGSATPPRSIRLVRKDGAWAHIEIGTFPIRFGGAPAVVWMGVDVTQHRVLTADMMRMDRMIAVGTLAAGVAHEINNPMQFVFANVEHVDMELERCSARLACTLPAQDLDAVREMRKALKDALDGATRVRLIVQDLRTLSRSDDAPAAPTSLLPVLESSLNMAMTEIRHRARLVKDFQPVPTVLANGARLGQVFLNLLVNAAHAIPAGRARENEIRVRTRTNAHGHAVVEVEDTGTGIAADIQANVFDPFFTTKPVGQGTGLGLAICQGIVRELGGTIQFSTQPGVGTTFQVTLPPARPDRINNAVPADSGGAGSVELAPCRILVVDDEPLMGVLVRRMLGPGHVVTSFKNAREALDVVRRGALFDVILCDLMMPDVTGMEFQSILADTNPALAARVVMMTGGAFTQQARDAMESATNKLLKPFSATDLRALVEAMTAGNAASSRGSPVKGS